MAAAGHGQTAVPYCDLFRCFCRWHLNCSDSIHRVAPGMDYRLIQDGVDDRHQWSVLVGCTCADQELHNLRLHRFLVTSSGRVMGHSNDLLQHFFAVHPEDKKNTVYAEATAALGPGGQRLDVICSHYPPPHLMRADKLDLPPKAVTVDLVNKSMSTLEPLPFLHGSYHAVSAHGELWAPAVVKGISKDDMFGWRLLVHRLAKGGNGWRWDEVISHHSLERLGLRGYAVIGDKFILLSLINSTFFCFNCETCSLTPVPTTDKASDYVCISGRAVHIQGSDTEDGGTIYFIKDTTLFAYKYSPEKNTPIEPPVMVDMLWPYYKEGHGFVVQLEGQMLCAVWINMYEACSCATRHVMITTFRITSSVTEPNGHVHSIKVLHSTCRRVDMLRDESYDYNHYDTFAILQEYTDDVCKVDDTSLPAMYGGFSHPVKDSQEILTCCRNYLQRKGEMVWTADSLVDCKVVTKCDLYFICQVDQHSVLYQISTSGGKLRCDATVLEPKLCLDTIRDGGVSVDFPATWHFVYDGSKLFVIPSFPHHSQYMVDLSSMSSELLESKQRAIYCQTSRARDIYFSAVFRDIYFSAVFRAGEYIVGIGEKLKAVYTLDKQTLQWVHHRTSGNLDLEQAIKVSGFVDIGGSTFLISDFDTEKCFFCDLRRRHWLVVEPPSMSTWLGEVGLLSGRCIFVEGFIYTCSDEGLEAYEFVKDHWKFTLGAPIVLEFPWRKFSDRRFMSFECISKNDISGGIVFCVIQGYSSADPLSHSVTTTTVIVEREDAPRGKKLPVRIKHIDVAVSSVHHEQPILTNYAFAL